MRIYFTTTFVCRFFAAAARHTGKPSAFPGKRATATLGRPRTRAHTRFARAGHGGGGDGGPKDGARKYEENRTYCDSWHARRRRGRSAGEQAVEGAQDRMEHDTHGGRFFFRKPRKRQSNGTPLYTRGMGEKPFFRATGTTECAHEPQRKSKTRRARTRRRIGRTEPRRPRGLECRAPTTVGRRAPRAQSTHLPYGYNKIRFSHFVAARRARARRCTYAHVSAIRARTPLRRAPRRGTARQTAHARARSHHECAHATIHPLAPNRSPTTVYRPKVAPPPPPPPSPTDDYVTTPACSPV